MLLKFILFLVALTPNHELNKNTDLLLEVEQHFIDAGEKYGIEPSWLVYYAERESSLDINRVGPRGEVGYPQAHGVSRQICELRGYDPKTRRGGAFCMALLMDMNIRYCGNFNHGMARYASGSCNLAREMMWKRYNDYDEKWRKVFNGEMDAEKRRDNAMEKYLAEASSLSKRGG